MTIAKLAGSSCSVSRLAVLGERSTLSIVRDALAGMTKFEAFRESLGTSADVLLTGAGRQLPDDHIDIVHHNGYPHRMGTPSATGSRLRERA